MSALLILNYDVHDPAKLDGYREAATPVLIGPGRATLLASTPTTEHLPEAPTLGTHTVVLRFDSEAAARDHYWSAEYQGLLPQRLSAVTPRAALLVPGTDAPGSVGGTGPRPGPA